MSTGFYCNHPHAAGITRQMIKSSDKAYVLAGNSKINHKSPKQYAGFDEIEALLTVNGKNMDGLKSKIKVILSR